MPDTNDFSQFDKLLELLGGGDREAAGVRYEALRRRLIRFFDWRGCETADDLADVVFDRVARKIGDGESIANVEAYAATVAQFVYREFGRSAQRRNDPLDDHGDSLSVAPAVDGDEDQRFACLDKCLAALDPGTRRMLVAYHDTDERTMIAARRRLAESFGFSINTLRIKICRLKNKLEQCVRACCGDQ